MIEKCLRNYTNVVSDHDKIQSESSSFMQITQYYFDNEIRSEQCPMLLHLSHVMIFSMITL
jgi:hypothetical protein